MQNHTTNKCGRQHWLVVACLLIGGITSIPAQPSTLSPNATVFATGLNNPRG